MQKISLAVSLIVIGYFVESIPIGIETLEFDNLDTDLDSLMYEVDEEDLDDFGKLLDGLDDVDNESLAAKSKNTANGYNKKKRVNKGNRNKHSSQDSKKLYKIAGTRDQERYDGDNVYAVAEGAEGQAVGIKGNEDKSYRKGSKTRGFHRVHHKDEYKKDRVFYDDDETKGTIKKIGAKRLGYKLGAGAGFNRGHFQLNSKKELAEKQEKARKGISENNYGHYSDVSDIERL